MSSAAAEPLVTLTLESRAFAADWGHCDQVANYLAQLVSHDRTDSFLYANLLSTVLNEVMEVVFARHGDAGSVRCHLLRREAEDRLVFEIPVRPEDRTFYERSAALARQEGVTERYTRSLLSPEPLDHALGLLELVSDYGATLTLEAGGAAHDLRLTLDLVLDRGLTAGAQPHPL